MNQTNNPIFNLPKTVKSFRYAFKGIYLVFRNENNMKVHLTAAISAIILSIFLKLSLIEWVIILMQIGLVWTAETVNTALEKVVDWISPEYHVKAGVIKDIASGAVLITSVMALIIGLLIFGRKVVELL